MRDVRDAAIQEQLEIAIINTRHYRAGNLSPEEYAERMAVAADLLEHGELVLRDQLQTIDALSAAAWAAVEEPRWTVTELLPAEPSLCVLYGPTGTFKSFLAMDLFLAMATGQTFLPPADPMHLGWEGFQPTVPARILYIAAEDSAPRLKNRLAELRAFRGLDSPGAPLPMGSFQVHPVHGPSGRRPVLLSHHPHRLEVARRVAGDGIHIVVYDTLAESVRGIEENSTKDMSAVIDGAHEIQAAGATCFLIHHNRKPAQVSQLPRGVQPAGDASDPYNMRGSTALMGAADILLSTSPWGDPEQADQMRFRVAKSRVMEKALWRDFILDVRPEPDESPAKFLYASDYRAVNEARREAKEDRLQALEAAVLELYYSGGAATAKAVAAKLDTPEGSTRNALRELVRRGLLDALRGHRNPDGSGGALIYTPPAAS